MKDTGRIIRAVIAGSVLGILCIVGIGLRLGFEGNAIFLLSAWFNRVVMGLAIGLAGNLVLTKRFNPLYRGALLGLIISFSWFISTEFRDTLGFIAGIAYGIIIDYIATGRRR